MQHHVLSAPPRALLESGSATTAEARRLPSRVAAFVVTLLAVLLLPVATPAQGGSSPATIAGPDVVPSSGSYLVLSSDPAHRLLSGESIRTESHSSRFSIRDTRALGLVVDGDRDVRVDLHLGDEAIATGPQRDLASQPSERSPSTFVLTVDGRSCDAVTDLDITEVNRDASGALTTFAATFVHRCGGIARGAIRVHGDVVSPRPTNPRHEPANVWRPSPSDIPDDATSYLALAPDARPGTGERTTDSDSRDDVSILASGDLERLSVAVFTPEGHSRITLVAPEGDVLRVGHYGDVRQLPEHNPVRGGFAVNVNGHQCDDATGWFSIDHLGRTGTGEITSLQVRFRHVCSGTAGPALHALLSMDAPRPTVVEEPRRAPGHADDAPSVVTTVLVCRVAGGTRTCARA